MVNTHFSKIWLNHLCKIHWRNLQKKFPFGMNSNFHHFYHCFLKIHITAFFSFIYESEQSRQKIHKKWCWIGYDILVYAKKIFFLFFSKSNFNSNDFCSQKSIRKYVFFCMWSMCVGCVKFEFFFFLTSASCNSKKKICLIRAIGVRNISFQISIQDIIFFWSHAFDRFWNQWYKPMIYFNLQIFYAILEKYRFDFFPKKNSKSVMKFWK